MSTDGQRANNMPQNYRGRPSFTTVSFLAAQDERFNSSWRQQFCPHKKSIKELSINFDERRLESLPATKNHQGLWDSEDESDTKIFSVPDSETGQQSSHHIQPELMRRQPQQGKADKVLVENNFDMHNLCHMAIKIFRNIFTTVTCKCTIKTLHDDSNSNAFQTFWSRLNILRLVNIP